MNESKITVKNVRFSYAYVFEMDRNEKYSTALLIKKNDPQIPEIKAAISAAVANGMGTLGQNYKLDFDKILHDGDDKEDEAYHGCYYINAKSKKKPGIVKKNETGLGGKTVEIVDPTEFYSGCYGAAGINFYAFNTGTNKGIACGLNNVLKLRDGEYLGSKASAEADFGSIIDEMSEDDIC